MTARWVAPIFAVLTIGGVLFTIDAYQRGVDWIYVDYAGVALLAALSWLAHRLTPLPRKPHDLHCDDGSIFEWSLLEGYRYRGKRWKGEEEKPPLG
jgi:hypothetical protein